MIKPDIKTSLNDYSHASRFNGATWFNGGKYKKGNGLLVQITNKFKEIYNNPANTGHSPNFVSILGQRRRRWANIEPEFGECPVFAGNVLK